jgi:hypothetical protein
MNSRPETLLPLSIVSAPKRSSRLFQRRFRLRRSPHWCCRGDRVKVIGLRGPVASPLASSWSIVKTSVSLIITAISLKIPHTHRTSINTVMSSILLRPYANFFSHHSTRAAAFACLMHSTTINQSGEQGRDLISLTRQTDQPKVKGELLVGHRLQNRTCE